MLKRDLLLLLLLLRGPPPHGEGHVDHGAVLLRYSAQRHPSCLLRLASHDGRVQCLCVSLRAVVGPESEDYVLARKQSEDYVFARKHESICLVLAQGQPPGMWLTCVGGSVWV